MKDLDVIVAEAARRYVVEDEHTARVTQALHAKIQQAYVAGVLKGFELAGEHIDELRRQRAANDEAGQIG